MDRVQAVPVDKAPHALGREVGGLRKERLPWRLGMHVELQPAAARHLHLGTQPDQVVRFDGLNPPEIQRLAHAQTVGISPAAPHADAAHQPIEQAAYVPHPVHVEPATAAAQAGKHSKHGRSVRRYLKLAVFEIHPFKRGQNHRRNIPLGGHQGVAPHGFNFPGIELDQGQLHGSLVVEGLDLREDSCRAVIAHDNLIAQPLD